MSRQLLRASAHGQGRGTRLIICIPRARSHPLAERLRVMLEPQHEKVEVSASPGVAAANPDLSLLVNGWGALEPLLALRECQLRFPAPVVVVVSHRHQLLIAELLRAGAADCVRWPVSSAELTARIEMRLPRIPQDITLDATSLTFVCHTVNVKLTLSEFRIVHHLLQNAARWSTSEEMTTAALRSGRSSESVLRVHVYSIRRKLKQESWRLLSSRAFGYRFDIQTSSSELENDGSRSVE